MTTCPSISRRTVLGATAAAGAVGLGTAPEARARPRTLTLTRNGTTRYRVLVGTQEDDTTRYAADELASYLNQITGATFPVVVADDLDDYGHLIVVGTRNAFAAKPRLALDGIDLGEDGFALRVQGQSLLVAGHISRGTMYGVFWILDRLCGVRWLAPDFTVVPDTPSLELLVGQLNSDHKPSFRNRIIYGRDGLRSSYRQHLMLNARVGRLVSHPTIKPLRTWSDWFPEAATRFHALVRDSDLWSAQQLEMMNPRTRTAMAIELRRRMADRVADGKDPGFSILQEDANWDPVDPESQAFADDHGGVLSAPLVDMMNAVTERVRRVFPEARTAMQAYMWSHRPPTGLKLNDHSIVTIAPLRANFAEPLLTGSQNEEYPGIYQQWNEVSANTRHWDYLVNFAAFLQPYPTYWAGGESIKELATTNVQGYFGNAANVAGAEFAHLRFWVHSHLLWDAELDVDQLIREFLDAYYGAAAPDVLAYMRLMVDAVARTGALVAPTAMPSPIQPFLDFATMRQADEILARATEAVRDDADRFRHVQGVRLNVDYVILMRRAEFEYLAQEQGLDWTADYDNRVARFISDFDDVGVTAELDPMLEVMRLERVHAEPPAAVDDLPADQWVDKQEYGVTVDPDYGERVIDEAASDHVALRIDGVRPGRGIRVGTGRVVPRRGTWSVYFSVRADLVAGADPNAVAFEIVIDPPFPGIDTRRRVTVAELGDGTDYREIRLPGSLPFTGGDRMFYLSGVGNAEVTHIYLDRIFVIRVE